MFFQKTFMDELREKAIRANTLSKKTIIFPELDEKVIKACSIMIQKKIAHPLIIANEKDVRKITDRLKIKNIGTEHILDHLADKNSAQLEDYARKYYELRHGKILSMEEAKSRISQPHYYGAMLVNDGHAEGMITGINSATKPYYPAFEIIGTREGVSRASGVFMLVSPDSRQLFFFADCVLNMSPNAEQLSEIALTTANTAISFGIKPKIAMLSFSTRDSAKHESVDKVKAATRLVKQANPGLVVDGEIQLDAAIVPEVSRKKAPDSVLEGDANVLIFPDLNAGNIGYKLVERLGKYRAIGPIMQGLNKPVNDLSRGCSVDDIVDLAAITVLQSL